MEKIELLAPAGSFEKLKLAVAFGADAVYFGGKEFSLRARSGNFSGDEVVSALSYLHERGKKGYIAVNVYQRNDDIPGLIDYLSYLQEIKPDGIIISNIGMLRLVKTYAKDIPVHISTQANITDVETARMWKDLGARRLILARELSLDEIRFIAANAGIDCEIFVHGAMCMAYSGRCFISKYLTGRDANQGDCAHPCRWEYYVREKSRKNELYEIEEDERGLYLFNSKDLMLFDHIAEILKAGIVSLKIEGRIKGILYLATVIRSYRLLIDALETGLVPEPRWRELLFEANNRGYHDGFILNADGYESNLGSSKAAASYDLLGYIDYDGAVLSKAPFKCGETYGYLTPGAEEGEVAILSIHDEKGLITEQAKTDRRYGVTFSKPLPLYTVLRYAVV